jgi:hypothetical protein
MIKSKEYNKHVTKASATSNKSEISQRRKTIQANSNRKHKEYIIKTTSPTHRTPPTRIGETSSTESKIKSQKQSGSNSRPRNSKIALG